MTLDRRRMLRLTGATAAASMAGLAGCMGSDDDNKDDDDTDDENENGGEDGSDVDYPVYEQWLTGSGEELTFAYLDWEALEEHDRDDPTDVGGADDLEEVEELQEEDPMLGMPIFGALAVGMSVGFAVTDSGLNQVIDMESDTLTMADFETELREVLLVDEAFVFVGDVEPDEIATALTEEADQYAVSRRYERADEVGEYEMYEPVDSDDNFGSSSDGAIAVGADAIVFSDGSGEGDALELVTDVLSAHAGDSDGATAKSEDFGWLLETAGRGQLVFGGYGEVADEDESDSEETTEADLAEATGLVSSFSYEGDGGASGEFAVTFETLDGETKAEFESTLGSSADDASIEIESDRLWASATWEAGNEALE